MNELDLKLKKMKNNRKKGKKCDFCIVRFERHLGDLHFILIYLCFFISWFLIIDDYILLII